MKHIPGLLLTCLCLVQVHHLLFPLQALAQTAPVSLEEQLLVAVQALDYPLVFDLLKRGATPNYAFVFEIPQGNSSQPSYEHDSALMAAVRGGNWPIIQLLMEHGANANLRVGQSSPFERAILEGPGLVHYLLKQGAKPEGLDSAVASNAGQTAALLVKYGANPSDGLAIAVEREYAGWIKWLLSKGARVDQAPKALAWAIQRRDLALIPQLLASGSVPNEPVNLKDNQGNVSALQRALEQPASEIVWLLLAAGADFMALPQAVMLAAEQGDLRLVDWLLERQPQIPNTELNQLMFSQLVGNPPTDFQLLMRLLEHGAPFDRAAILESAVFGRKQAVLKRLIELGAQVNTPYCALCQVAWIGPPENFFFLVKQGADLHGVITQGRPSYHGHTALTGAVTAGEAEIVSYLFAQGVTLAEQKIDPLFEMVRYPWGLHHFPYAHPQADPATLAAKKARLLQNYAQVVALLKQQGADINALKDGRTPLMVALEHKQVEMARVLLQSGANPDIQGAGGKTARDVAREKGIQADVGL